MPLLWVLIVTLREATRRQQDRALHPNVTKGIPIIRKGRKLSGKRTSLKTFLQAIPRRMGQFVLSHESNMRMPRGPQLLDQAGNILYILTV